MSKAESIVRKWKEGAKQIDIAKELDITEAYVSQILAPEKKRKKLNSEISNYKGLTYTLPTTKNDKNDEIIIKSLRRSITSIHNKPEVKKYKEFLEDDLPIPFELYQKQYVQDYLDFKKVLEIYQTIKENK